MVQWTMPVGPAEEPAIFRVAEAVERIVLIGQMPGSPQDRYKSATFAVLRFAQQSRAWHVRFGSIDVESRVRGEMGDLEGAVARRLGAFEDWPEGAVAQLLEGLTTSFPRRTR